MQGRNAEARKPGSPVHCHIPGFMVSCCISSAFCGLRPEVSVLVLGCIPPMNSLPCEPSLTCPLRPRAPGLLAVFALMIVLLSALQAATAGGAVSGSVSNAGTGDLLEGVRVTLPDLGLTAFTDNTGRYIFSNVPPGAHSIVANYTGLDSIKHDVTRSEEHTS